MRDASAAREGSNDEGAGGLTDGTMEGRLTCTSRLMAPPEDTGHVRPSMFTVPTFRGRDTVVLPQAGPWWVYRGCTTQRPRRKQT